MAQAKKNTGKKSPISKKKTPKPKKPTREDYHLLVRSEEEQFEGLSEDLIVAWKVLRRFLIDLGDQEIRTSHRAITFARKTAYFFVRPKRNYLELNLFLPQALKSKLLKKVEAVSKTKYVHVMQVTHSDQIEEPLTDWIRDAFEYSG